MRTGGGRDWRLLVTKQEIEILKHEIFHVKEILLSNRGDQKCIRVRTSSPKRSGLNTGYGFKGGVIGTVHR